jgi:LysM repeat protein
VYQVFVPKGGAATFAANFQESYDPEPLVASSPSRPVSYKPPPPARQESPPAQKTLRYEVKRGDTLAKIAAKYDASVSELMKWNKLVSAAHITPGRQLVIFRD